MPNNSSHILSRARNVKKQLHMHLTPTAMKQIDEIRDSIAEPHMVELRPTIPGVIRAAVDLLHEKMVRSQKNGSGNSPSEQ